MIDALVSENPDHAAKITFVSIDWHIHEAGPLTVDLNIPRRSTLVVVAETGRNEIQALLDAALGAASSQGAQAAILSASKAFVRATDGRD